MIVWEATMDSAPVEEQRSAAPAPLGRTALTVAVCVLVAWLALLGWLLASVDATDATWERMLAVLASLQAVAFAAAGALFGTSVQGQRVADQRQRAEAAEVRAAAGDVARVNGEKLAAAVKLDRARRAPNERQRLSADHPENADPLLDLAQRLFPD
ncbi:hypothetical protein [Actinoplanes sp. NPDC049802]|uniref:hypothetical protein n=1 Tax=Actinoplanes sp. NPDC049802 TaxID=3154742 RepID=UPI0033DBDCDE